MPTSKYWDEVFRKQGNRRRFLQGAAVTGAGLALTACGGGGSSTATPASGGTTAAGTAAAAASAAAPKRGGTLNVGATIDLLWPALPYHLNTPYITTQFAVYDTLFRYDSASDLKPVPRLGQSYEFNGDQTELTVTLKPNLTFHDGKPLDAAAVVASFEAITAKGTPANQVAGLAKAYVDTATAVDAQHVKFALKRPGNLVFDMFNFWLVADASNIAAMQTGALPNGSGAFKVTSVQPKQGGKLEAFKGFWKPAVLDAIDYKVFPDPASLAVAMQSGTVDFTKDLSADDAQRFAKDSSFNVLTDKGLTADYSFGMNTKGQVTGDPRIRKALYMLVDRKRVVENVFLGDSTPMNSLWPTGSPAYEKRYDQDPFNIDAAKQLVTQAGYATGTPPIEVMVGSADFATQQIFDIVQADAKKAGINLQINRLEDAALLAKFVKGDFPGCYSVTFGFNNMHPDSLFVMNYQVRIPNSTNFDTPEYEQFQKTIAAAKTDADRQAAYAQFNKLWDDNMWVFLHASQTMRWATSKKVTGFTVNDYSVPDMENIGLA